MSYLLVAIWIFSAVLSFGLAMGSWKHFYLYEIQIKANYRQEAVQWGMFALIGGPIFLVIALGLSGAGMHGLNYLKDAEWKKLEDRER